MYVIERYLQSGSAPVFSEVIGKHPTKHDAEMARRYMVIAARDDGFTVEKGLPDSAVIVLVRTRVKIDFVTVECRCSSIVLHIQEII